MKTNYKITIISIMLLSIAFQVSADSSVKTSINSNVNNSGTVSNVEANVTAEGNNSDTEIYVENKVESSSSNNVQIYKRIETTVNGEKKVIESNQPGETKLEIGNTPDTPSPTLKTVPKPTITVKPQLNPHFPSNQSIQDMVNKIINDIRQTLRRIFQGIGK